MGFLEWLESTSLAEWAMASLEGYPIIITAHSIGLALMVGPILILNFRLLGWLPGIPFTSFNRILQIAWIGFGINALSGMVLFTMEATGYVTDIPFLIKFTLVMLGALSAAFQHSMISRDGALWSTSGVPPAVSVLAASSLVFWTGAIIAGRLTAYID